MNTNFQQMLRIAADALSLKYSLNHAVLYWHNSQNSLETKASLDLIPDLPAGMGPHSISESLMGAIRKPLVIVKSDINAPKLQIIIPLIENNQKLGVMAFWGAPEGEVAKESDRRFLDMIGMISLRVLLGLQDGVLQSKSAVEDSEKSLSKAVAEPIQADSTDFINVGPLEDEVFEDVVTDEEDDLEELLEEISFEDEDDEEESAKESTLDLYDMDEVVDFSEIKEELKPDQSSSDLKRLFELTGIGFLIFDKTGNIRTDSEIVNPRFFGLDLDQKSALEILFGWGTPINKDSASFEPNPNYDEILDLMQSVFSRVTSIDVVKELLPCEVEREDNIYGLDYHYFKSPAGVEKDVILAVYRDISREKQLASSYVTEMDRVNMVIKVALDIDGYNQYRDSAEHTFELIEEAFNEPESEINLETILHQLQAIQGGAEIYEINEITVLSEELLSSLEKKIVDYTPLTGEEIDSFKVRLQLLQDRFHFLQKQYLDNLVSDQQILDKAVYRNTKTKILNIRDRIIDEVLKKHMQELEETFEKNYKPFTRLKNLEDITQKRLNRIKGFIRNRIVEEGEKEVTEIMSELRKQPIGLMLKRYAIIAVNLGERLKKRVEVEIKGADIEVPFHALESIFTGLVFVIRNCVEHGLETMEERIALNKSLEGNIDIEAAKENDVLRITIADDGRGIDVDKIRQAAVKNRLITEEEADKSSDDQILKLMFSKGFSTKKDTNGTFGRGVGLNAVGSAIDELGGEVRVQTRLKEGTTVVVEIPL